jgi:2Fe-2S ferredoxin
VPNIRIFDASGQEHALSVSEGETVMHAMRNAGLPILGECNGSMVCATCHVVVEPEWADRLAPPTEDEEATLDTVFSLAPTSRLGCQIRLCGALDGLTVRLPGR